MKLEELLHKADLKCHDIIGNINIDVKDLNIDSRKITAGDIFVAVKGTVTDGHNYVGKAIEQGAVAVVCEKLPEKLTDNVVYIVVENSESVVGKLATMLLGNPTSKLKLVGVTGTNGKTTIATVLYNLFRRLGYKVGLISTVCNYIDGKAIPTEHTTPDPVTLNKLLSGMVDAGCEYAFMEVSSHSVVQHRIDGLIFAGGIFTNLTRDHLDYHKTFDNYLKAKKTFFDNLSSDAFAITNKDDRNGEIMLQNTKADKYTYSVQTMADFNAKILESHFEGMILEIDSEEVALQFVGRFNVSNLLAVYGAAVLLGEDKHNVLVALSALRPVSGRFETIRSPKGFTAIVDYAHTPDALVNVLNTIHDVLEGKGRVITVVGAGGNRDKGKRPIMASEAAKLSDKLVITSDNPRFEEPQDIINDMLAGLSHEELQRTVCISERREAIRTACMLAQNGDVVLVAGKGHENYQEIKGIKHHFDDKEVILEIFDNQ